MRSHNRTF